jgi:hypothetical protein
VTLLQSSEVSTFPKPSPTTALAVRPVNYGALSRTSLARLGMPSVDFGDASVLSWSLIGLTTFSLTPTILQALNRLRVLSGLEPLQMREDGTIDLFDDPLLYQLCDRHPPFAE